MELSETCLSVWKDRLALRAHCVIFALLFLCNLQLFWNILLLCYIMYPLGDFILVLFGVSEVMDCKLRDKSFWKHLLK